MNILEKEIEDVLWDALNSNDVNLEERGLFLYADKWLRQFNLGEYGIPDIVGYQIIEVSEQKRNIHWSIIELKKDAITVGTFLQSLNYFKALEKLSEDFSHFEITIYLIGKSIDQNGSFCYLPDFVPEVNFITYEIDLIKGMTFKNNFGYSLSKDMNFLLAKERFANDIKTLDENGK